MVQYIKISYKNKIKEEYETFKEALHSAAIDYKEGQAYPLEIKRGDRILQGEKLIDKIIDYSNKIYKEG